MLNFLTDAQPILIPAGLFVLAIGVLLIVANILDTRRSNRMGRDQQISPFPGTMVIGVGILLLGITPLMSGASSFLAG